MAVPTRVNVTASADWSGGFGATLASSASSATTGTTLVVTLGANATSGQRVTGLTDTAGNTYLKAQLVNGPDNYCEELWYAPNITGHASNVVTATWSATVAYRGIVVLQYAGVATHLPSDGTATGTAASGGTTVTTGTLTTTRADTVQIIVPRWGYGPTGFDTVTWPAGFTRITHGVAELDIAEQFVSGTTATPYTITHTYTAIEKLALVAAFTATAPPAPLVAAVLAAPGGAGSGGTTRAIDTTGATLLVAGLAWYGGPSGTNTIAVSDNKSNTWTALTTHTTLGGGGRHTFYYVIGAAVGAGHTFTVSGTGTVPAVIVYAFVGVGTLHSESGAAQSGTGQPLASGSVTPSADGALIIAGLEALGAAATDTVAPAGFSGVTTLPFLAGVNVHSSAAYQVQTTAAAINPTWSWSPGGTHDSVSVSTAVFLPVVAATGRVQSFVWMPV